MARKSVIKFYHITSYFETQPKLIEKGENAVEAGHVRNLFYDGDRRLVTATIEASMKDKTYAVQIQFKSDGHIQSSHCECPRGRVQCHHIAAALIYAHHNVSITDGICQWNYQNPVKKKDISATKTVEEMFPSKQFKASKQVDEKTVREEVHNNISEINAVVGYRWILSKEPDPASLSYITMEEILFSTPAEDMEEKAKSSSQKITAIELETKGQSSNWKWAKYRKFLITASNFGSVIAAIKRNSFPPSLFKKLNGSYNLKNVKSIQWGIQNEKNAIKVFEDTMKKSVKQSGLWLDPSGLLGASPDGLIYNTDGSMSLIEVKCPFKYRNDVLKEILEKDNKYILQLDQEKNYIINENHLYYHQIQGQLAITKANMCYLIIWTTKSTVIFDVFPDPKWNHLPSLMDFYIKKWTPWVLENHRR